MKKLQEFFDMDRLCSPAGVIVLVLAMLLLIAVFGAMKNAYGAEETPSMRKPDIVEVMEIRGVIHSGTADAVKTQVEKINDNPKIKAVLLVVHSPGGGATATAVLYQELSKLKAPVVGYCEYVCASGGIYALMSPSVKYIAVGDETIGGSVGVIMHVTRFNRLLEWAKIDNETYRSGHLKDAGNPTRAAQHAEQVYLQGIVQELAEKFYGVVLKARKGFEQDAWNEITSAKIFIGQKIVDVGLADAVMTRDQAVQHAKKLSGSKMIFTREELGKMSKAAHEGTSYKAPAIAEDPRVARAMDDLNFFADLAREIRSGETVRFEYRAPYQF